MKHLLQHTRSRGIARFGGFLVLGFLALFGVGAAQAASEDNILVAPDYRGGPDVRVYQEDGTLVKSFMAYAPNIRASYQVEWGDVDGDGVKEIITMPYDGASPQIRIFRQDGTVIGQFNEGGSRNWYNEKFLLADFDGDGKDEFAFDDGVRNGRISVFRWVGAPWQLTKSITGWHPYGSKYSGGVNMAAGDVNGDGRAELIITPGEYSYRSGPNVRVYQYNATTKDMELLTWFWGESQSYRGDLSVAAGDWDGDGDDEIFTTMGEDKKRGAKNTIYLHSWNASTGKMETVTMIEGPYNTATGVENNTLNYREILGSGGAPAYYVAMTRGLKLYSGDVDGNGADDLVMTPTQGSHIRAYTHMSGGTIGTASLMDWGHAYGDKFNGKLNLSLNDVDGDGDVELATVPKEWWGKSHVKVWRWDVSTQKRSLIGSFFAYPNYRWGAYLAQ